MQNARRDPRFRDNPLVVDDPKICFYAGAPLKTPGGHKLGTLCIIDRVPRRLSDEERTMLKNLADMVVGEMINFVDTETGLANRTALLGAGAKCFDLPPQGRRFSLLLLDINDMIATQLDTDTEGAPEVQFPKLLHKHFPDALCIAHLGANDFCVLLRDDPTFDETLALSRLCTDARKALCSGADNEAISPLVGRMKYNREEHHSFDDVIREADKMFYRREKLPLPQRPERLGFLTILKRWHQTIY